MLIKLTCPIQHYAWGSTRSIPALLGADNSDNSPWAELWMGAHPKAPSRNVEGTSLEDLIAADPEHSLGRGSAIHGGRLPFLMKVLAAASPLSIQCHPNREQARAGFEREDAAGIDRGAPNRNYRDDNHKPELIYALEEFHALKGFRSAEEIQALIFALAAIELAPLLDTLEGPEGLRLFFSALLSLEDEAKQVALEALYAGREKLPAREAHWVSDLLERYPGDIGAFAPLFLNLVTLEPGEALYLGAGELHAYLQGTGMEIMASSDNVLRGGLTPKHVDPEELLAVLRFEPGDKTPMRGTPSAGDPRCTEFPVPCEDFRFSVLELGKGDNIERRIDAAEIIFFLGDELELSAQGQSPLVLARGEVAFCPASQGSYRARGQGRLFIASC